MVSSLIRDIFGKISTVFYNKTFVSFCVFNKEETVFIEVKSCVDFFISRMQAFCRGGK